MLATAAVEEGSSFDIDGAGLLPNSRDDMIQALLPTCAIPSIINSVRKLEENKLCACAWLCWLNYKSFISLYFFFSQLHAGRTHGGDFY